MNVEDIIFVFFSIIVLAVLFNSLVQSLISYRKPSVSIEAKVVKIYDKYSGRTYYARGRGGFNFSPRYHITFRFKNGKKKIFICPSLEYKWVKLGDEGILTHQGVRFISFKKAIYRNDYS